jgi:hypothetical protein
VLGTLLAGRFLAWLGPALLGPPYAERLQRLEADAARATERNRIAREIHDSVGHALSRRCELGRGRNSFGAQITAGRCTGGQVSAEA